MIIGVDIGGTKIRIGCSEFGKKIDRSITFPSPQNQRVVIATIAENIREIAGNNDIDAISIAIPGPIDKKRGMILKPINLTWRNLRLTHPLKQKFDCPVSLNHDATCGGVTEARLGSGRGEHIVLYVSISTGIGTGIVIDGQPFTSRYNSEGGYQIIDMHYHAKDHATGTFQNITAGKSLAKRFGKIAKLDARSPLWQLIAHDLSIGLHNCINIIQPDVVVLGGGVSVHYQKFIKPLQKNLTKLPSLYPTPPIKQAKFVETAPLLGAILIASQDA